MMKKTTFYSLIVILAAQLSMNLFVADFKISIAIIGIPLFLFLTEDFPLIPVTLCSAAGVYLSRILFYWFQQGQFDNSFRSFLPEMFFYICYGLLLYVYTRLTAKRQTEIPVVIPLIFIDYVANLTELFVRVGGQAFETRAQASLFLVAFLRSLIVWCILSILERYRILLLKREHEERYRRLVLLTSKLNGEIVWMQKNTSLIEQTMKTSYQLYEQLKKEEALQPLTSSALTVAKDIHEIKKEYLLIMRGISEALDEELTSDGMWLEELLFLLKDAMVRLARDNGKELHMKFSLDENFYTNKHYALMSIFRNLFINSIEASKGTALSIHVTQTCEDEMYHFQITDDGPGIPSDYLDDVFETGFSTKINYATGEINRGLGLNLVKDLVEDTLKGEITLTSEPGNTTFTLSLPKPYTKGNTHEILSN